MSGLIMPTNNFWNMARNHSQSAESMYKSQTPNQKTEFTPPGKTAGGAIGPTAGGAMAGYSVGGPYGAVVGAGVGLLSYMLS